VTRLLAGRSGVRFQTGARNLTLLHNVQIASGIHSACYSVGTGFLSLGLNRLGRESAQTPPSSAEGNEWSYTSNPSKHPHGAYGEDFTLFLTFTPIHWSKHLQAWIITASCVSTALTKSGKWGPNSAEDGSTRLLFGTIIRLMGRCSLAILDNLCSRYESETGFPCRHTRFNEKLYPKFWHTW
jgi:hypothetical protein